MAEDDRSPSDDLLARHPELAVIGEALEQRRRGEPIAACCPRCGQPLVVTEVVAVGAVHVSCPCGHVRFRASTNRTR